MMNTTITQHGPTAIELLSDVLLSRNGGRCSTYQEITEEIADIWLPIFHSQDNFMDALQGIRIALADHDQVVNACDEFMQFLGAD